MTGLRSLSAAAALTIGCTRGGTGAENGVGSSPRGAVSGSRDEMAGYNPCPASGSPCRIMPLGDSITDGAGSSTGGGYRVPLFRRALADGKALTFVGSSKNGPSTIDGITFPRSHEGHSGYTIDPGGDREGISPLVVASMRANKPHIVTLMIGTNDVTIDLDLAGAPRRLGRLMDTLLAIDPQVLLIVATLVPTTDDELNVRVRDYNAAIAPLVKARVDAGRHVAMVDLYAVFTGNAGYKTVLMSDDLHPADAGYVVMADCWYAVVKPFLR
jgi:lysophospholipase L1-like esterase